MTSPEKFARLRTLEAVFVGAIAVLIVVLLVTPVWGAEKVWGALQIPYRWFSPPTKDRVCVQVQWVSRERAAELCKGGGACWFPSATGNADLIIAPQPASFNDTWALHVLGHEFFHALGASHD
jgi:hypothetical protein